MVSPSQAKAPAILPARTSSGPAAPSAACDTLVHIDPGQIPSHYRWETYWSLSVNFKAFVRGNLAAPYACLKLYGLDHVTGTYISLVPKGEGIPITGCKVFGQVAISSKQLPGLSTVVGVATFGSRGGYVACELNLRDTVDKLYKQGAITALPSGAPPQLKSFYEYDAFAYLAAGSVQVARPIKFASYQPGVNCSSDAAASGVTGHCGEKAFAADPVSASQFELRATTDGASVTTQKVVLNQYGMASDSCLVNLPLATGPRIWASYLGSLPGNATDQYHILLDITNTDYHLLCQNGGAVPTTPFYTGSSILYIGGAPGTANPWGELYELTADPGGSSVGTDGVK